MNEIWHALGFATLAIFAAGLMVVAVLAHFSSEASEAGLITNLKLRRVLWGIACFFWGYEVVSLFLDLLWKTSPGKLYVASVAGAIVITGFIVIRGMRATYQPSSQSLLLRERFWSSDHGDVGGGGDGGDRYVPPKGTKP